MVVTASKKGDMTAETGPTELRLCKTVAETVPAHWRLQITRQRKLVMPQGLVANSLCLGSCRKPEGCRQPCGCLADWAGTSQ